jgi:hypothetical protein
MVKFKVLAGDFLDDVDGVVETTWRGTTQLRLFYNPRGKGKIFGMKVIRYKFETDIAKFEVLTEQAYNQIAGRAVIGALLGGFPGAILGQLVSGRKEEVIFAITFTDERRVLASMPKKQFAPLQKLLISHTF